MELINHPLDTDSISSYYNEYQKKTKLSGGSVAEDIDIPIDIPSGGFPPLYLCSQEDLKENQEEKSREFKIQKGSVSIKSILEKRRNVAPITIE